MLPNIQNNNAFLMAMGTGSRIEIHAASAAKESWTQIDQTADAGDSQLVLAEPTGWQVGDKIAIAASSFDINEAEERTITAISADGRTVTLDRALEHKHYGEIEQYNNGLTGADYQEWDLDLRAEVALLSRNVTIQGDEDSTQDGYGGHTMVMMGAEMHIDGAELTQMGQAGALGRYPLHWHMLGDAAGQYITNSSIHATYNKGMTIHGTQNTWVENNVVHDTIGHGYYFEDGSEYGNVLKDNLGLTTRAAASVGAAPIGSDHTAVSTYWVTNPDNHLIGNHAAGSDEVGFWILSQDDVEGSSASSGLYVDYSPRAQTPGQWVGNSSHTNGADGIFIGRQFNESNGNNAGDPPLAQLFQLTDFTTYKNGEVGIWVRNSSGDLDDVKIAENNRGIQIWGQSNVKDSLIVGSTGNFDQRPGDEQHGWELYDHASHFENVHFDNFDRADDAAIAQGHGWGKSANNSAIGLTFGDNVPDDHVYRAKNTFVWSNEGQFDGDGTIAGAVHDLDGGISGVVGAVYTPGVVDWNPNENVDVLDYAYGGISASGFNASPGAIWESERVGWINPEGSIIGKMEYKTSNSESNREDFVISRSDNGARILFGSDAQGQSSRGQLNVDGSGDVEYIVSYPGELPDEIEIEFFDLPKGATAYYRFEGLPGDVVVQDATRYDNLAQVRAVDETAWFRDSNGDFVVKIYADRFNQRLAPRAETGTAQHQPYTDEFTIVIDARGSARPSGNRNPIEAPDDYFGPATPGALPERAESTSDTALIGAGDMRWSDASAWDSELPGADDTVVIGEGMRVVLDTDAVVKAIIVNGGELVVEDSQDLALAADWVLVINGGIFQVGTEDNPFQHDFDLTLEGDDSGNDIDVGGLVGSSAANIVRAIGGTYTDDNIEGTERGETVAALTGNDIVSMGAGDDHVDLGWGDDSADGGAGEDTLSFASLAPPSLEINGLTFGAVVDLALQGSAQNTGHGTDTFVNFEHLQGSEFNDNLLGNAGANRIDGAGGRDLLKGEAGEDTLLGGGGYDVLDGGTGADTLFGGTTGEAAIEMDIVAYFGASGPLIFCFGSSLSEIETGSSAEILQDTIGSDIEGFAGASDFSNTFNAENITTITAFLGGSQSDTFFGGSGTDQLLGAADNDEIHGNDGSDALIGESGNDDLYGGAGADAFFFDGNNEGHDTIHDLELGLDAVFISKGVLTELVFTETDADGNGVSDTLVTMLGGGGNQSITIIDLDAATVEAQLNISF